MIFLCSMQNVFRSWLIKEKSGEGSRYEEGVAGGSNSSGVIRDGRLSGEERNEFNDDIRNIGENVDVSSEQDNSRSGDGTVETGINGRREKRHRADNSTIEQVEIEGSAYSETIDSGAECLAKGILGASRQSRDFARLLRVVGAGSRRTSVYISNVVSYTDDGDVWRYLDIVKRRSGGSIFKFFSIHGTGNRKHIHVLHDCAWNAGSCRCFQPGLRYTGKYSGKTPMRDITEYEYERIFTYHMEGGRSMLYLKIGPVQWERIFHRSENLQMLRDSWSTATGSVEESDDENEVLWVPTGKKYFQPSNARRDFGTIGNRETEQQGEQRVLGRKRRAVEFGRSDTEEDAPFEDEQVITPQSNGVWPEDKVWVFKYDNYFTKKKKLIMLEAEQLEKALLYVCYAPIYEGDKTILWRNHKYFRYISDYEQSMKIARSNITLKFKDYKIRDYIEFYTSRSIRPLFNCTSAEYTIDNYFNLKDSVLKIKQLLIFQIMDQLDSDYTWDENLDITPVYDYIRQLVLLFDGKRGKCNTDYIVSPSCSGKTFFFDCWKDFLLSYGNMTNWNKNHQFPLQMCVDKRIIFWNEPNCEPAAYEDLKKVLAGESYSANRKNRDHVEIEKTPVIITANHRIFPNTEVFNCRIKYHVWRTAPFLRNNGARKLYPLALVRLIQEAEQNLEDSFTKDKIISSTSQQFVDDNVDSVEASLVDSQPSRETVVQASDDDEELYIEEENKE